MQAQPRAVGALVATLGVAGMLAIPGVASAATVINGGFETGDFIGWETVESGVGAWSVYSGTNSPTTRLPIGVPPEGTKAATTSQRGAGSHVLYQDVTLEPRSTHILKLYIYWVNTASSFLSPSPATLSYTDAANQQYRIDVMNPSAAVTSVAPGDVLTPIFQSQPSEPRTQAPKEITADLSAFAGQTVRIRLAEVDNHGFLSAAADDVRIESKPIAVVAPVTTPPATTPPATTSPTTRPPTTGPSGSVVARCSSRRRITIHLRPPRVKLTSAVVKLGDRKVKVRKGKRLTAVIDLRGRTKGTYTVTINARDAAGRHYRETRRYHVCRPRAAARGSSATRVARAWPGSRPSAAIHEPARMSASPSRAPAVSGSPSSETP
jgi:hypothetical protein